MRCSALALLVAAAATAGCGSEAVGELPPAAGPARSPALTATPVGRIVAVGAGSGAVTADPGAHTFAVGRALVDARTGRVRRVGVGAPTPRGVPADGGRLLAVLAPRARTLELEDPRTGARVAQAAAGIGPTHVAAAGDRVYVTDTQGGALLVFVVRPELALVRRVFLPGGPYAIADDPVRHRLWVTLTASNVVVSLADDGRPVPLTRLPTVRQPNAVAVDSALGTVAVAGRDAGVLQLIGAREADTENQR